MYQRRLCATGASATAAKKIIAQVKRFWDFPTRTSFLQNLKVFNEDDFFVWIFEFIKKKIQT
jgi:hypothetical protein